MLQPYGRILACTTHQKTCTIIYHTLSYFRDHQVSIAIIKSHVSFHHISRIILFHVSANIPVPHVFIFFMHQISFIVCQILFPYVTSSYIIVIFMRNHTSDIIFNHLCYMLIETIYLTYHTWFFKIINHTSCVMHQNSFVKARFICHWSICWNTLNSFMLSHALFIIHYSSVIICLRHQIPSICVQISSTMFQIPSLIHHSSHIMLDIGYHISASIIHHRYNEWYTIYNVPQSFITHRCSHTWFSHIIMHSRWKNIHHI